MTRRLFVGNDLGGSLFNGSSTWATWFNPSSQLAANAGFELLGIATYSVNTERDYRIRYVDAGGEN